MEHRICGGTDFCCCILAKSLDVLACEWGHLNSVKLRML